MNQDRSASRGTLVDTEAAQGSAGRPLRAGNASKRRAILAAARELFIAPGYDRTSVDAVAARAEVSKRTVYDYFGDKRRLLLAVVEDLGNELIDSVRSAIDATLVDPPDIEDALVRFAHAIADSVLGSPEHQSLLRLAASEEDNLPELHDWLDHAPEEMLADRLADLANQGLLDVSDPRLAADHFVALTIGPPHAHSFTTRERREDTGQRRARIAAGVRVYLSAYRTP